MTSGDGPLGNYPAQDSTGCRPPIPRGLGKVARFTSESVAAFRRNGWPTCVGIDGRIGSEYAPCHRISPLLHVIEQIVATPVSDIQPARRTSKPGRNWPPLRYGLPFLPALPSGASWQSFVRSRLRKVVSILIQPVRILLDSHVSKQYILSKFIWLTI